MPTPPKPFPLYTDGTGVFFTTDGVNFTQLGGGAAGSIPLSELAHQADQTVVGNIAGTASPVALTATQLTALVNPATPSLPGAMTAAQFSSLAGSQASKLQGVCFAAYSDVIDLTITGTYVVLPAMPFRLVLARSIFEIKTVTACSVSPTLAVGSNSASFNNLTAAGTFGAFTTGAAETIVSISVTANAIDLTASGLQINVSGGATATALTARYGVTYMLLPV